MRKDKLKFAVLRALRDEPDFAPLSRLQALSAAETRYLLSWLDRSGLALYFLTQLEEHGALSRISASLADGLRERLKKNIQRSADMIEEFHRLNARFRARNVRAIAMKGLTLVPDFCAAPFLRHQTDFDFLVTPESVEAAAVALRECEYTAQHLSLSGESYFTTPLRHTPSPADDLFQVQRHRQVDLHVSLWDPIPYLHIVIPTNFMETAETRGFGESQMTCLRIEDMFLLQVLHAFKHILRSWIRVSWLYELARFLRLHRLDSGLWQRILHRAGDSNEVRGAFAVVLTMTQHLFGTALPVSLRQWWDDAFTDRMRVWVERFGDRWALADWPGSLLNVFVASEFIPDRTQKRKYLASRFRPTTGQLSIGRTVLPTMTGRLRARSAQCKYVALRAVSHLTEVAALPREWLSWKSAVRSANSSHSMALVGPESGCGHPEKGAG